MNPFSQPKNYNDMLGKIMTFTFFISLGLVIVVAGAKVSVWNALHPRWMTFNVGLPGLKGVPAGYAVVALLVALATRISKLHDRVSDLFGIRVRFDLHEILAPLAGGVGIPVDFALRDTLTRNRHKAMYAVFYKYAGSTDPVIDRHLIWTALDRWSWFWICIEGGSVGAVAFVLLLSLGAFQSAAFVGAAVLLATLVSTQINRACASAAHSQVREILSDAQRRADVEAALRAL